MKDKLKLNQDFINFCIDFFEQEYYVNFFSNKYIYFSQNFDGNISIYYQIIGDLGGVPVNSWEDESKQSSVFIISSLDFGRLGFENSKEVEYIEDLINKRQTIKDTKAGVLSSDLLVLPANILIKYNNLRKNGKIKTPHLTTDKTKHALYEFKKEGIKILSQK